MRPCVRVGTAGAAALTGSLAPRDPAAGHAGVPDYPKPAGRVLGCCVNELDVVGVRVEMPSNQPIVLLREVGGDRTCRSGSAPGEATAIAFAQQGMTLPGR